jgi:hypothetical protein
MPKRLPPFYVDGARLLPIPVKLILFHTHPLPNDQRVLSTLSQICAIFAKLLILSKEFVRNFAKAL